MRPWNLTWFDPWKKKTQLLFSASSQSLSLPIVALIGSSRHSTNPPPIPQSTKPCFSTSEDLAVAVSQRRRGVQNTHRCLSGSSVFRKWGGGCCVEKRYRFHRSVVNPWLDHKGILPAATEKSLSAYSPCFYLSWQLVCVTGEAVNPTQNPNCHFVFTSSFSLMWSSC